MTRKRFQKLLRAHFTAYYLQHKDAMQGWISGAYRAAQHANARDRRGAYDAIVAALPINLT